LGWGWKSAIHPEDLDKLISTWLRLLASGEPGQEEARLRRFDGEYRCFLFRAVPVHDDMKKALSWAPCSGVWAASSWQTAELFFWTKLASFQRKPKLRFCEYYRSGKSSGWAAANRFLWTCACWRPPTPI